LSDPAIHLNGYQACFRQADAGLFLFAHKLDGCNTLLALPVAEFADLYSGPRYSMCLTGGDRCPLYCLDQRNLSLCTSPCAMAWVRAILQNLKQHRVPA
jgi:hypothetical protein